jgi:hypothetical protein
MHTRKLLQKAAVSKIAAKNSGFGQGDGPPADFAAFCSSFRRERPTRRAPRPAGYRNPQGDRFCVGLP